ncbi:peptidase family C50-domain-containing protein [Xylaria bambusicola]|uniref:peptidase family C50-domain-containing protein n=1 Tax=Xylaria bambusicola TaxID=326684 RepID=UPI002007CC33|nr:peptidase family C50-domain-containing protein [Xylaria bambusicola]KAI0512660.1 peptidase family C50-domain-containing protein [Xylaria bambusicola]
MASFAAQADAIRSAIVSVSTCTPATSAALKELLHGRQDHDESSKPTLKPSRKPAQSTAKTKPSTAKKPVKGAGDACNSSSDMSPKEKAVLATHVVNAALKALATAAKTPPPSSRVQSPSKGGAAKSAARTRLRRSASVPMTPLQPRSLNRVETSPVTTKTSLLQSTPASTGCLALVECARVSFATLRSLQASGAVTLPDFQLESGMSSLITKLIALRLFDHAVRELRILKRRLEGMALAYENKKSSASMKGTTTAPQTLSDLLDYPDGPYSKPLLGFIATAQLHALRIMYELNKTTHLEATLPFLRPLNSSSPLKLLLLCAEGEKSERAKVAKQLDTLSQLLLSMAPSLASKDDSIALEPRLSPSPETALEIQTLGLIARMESWNCSVHKGDTDKEILLPLAKCLQAFLRRTSPEQSPRLVAAFNQIWEKVEMFELQVPNSSNSSLASIYQLFAKGFQEAGNPKEAKKWTSKWRGFSKSEQESAAKCCAVDAQLLTLSLQDSSTADRNLVMQVLDGMQQPLSGSIVELDDLLVTLCGLRKTAFSIINKESSCDTEQGPNSCRDLLEKFIAQIPRFALRWLGRPPESKGSTKDLLRFEQRRQLLSKYLRQLLDSALFLNKTQLDEGRWTWETLDPLLQDILTLLDYMGDLGQLSKGNPSSSYHVKVSHLYYQSHLALRDSRATGDEGTSLRALKRSIDSVRSQPEPEQTRAQLLSKWEALVELCKFSNRKDDAIHALRSIRDHLVRCDTVQTITTSLASQPVRQSWKISPETELLSRSVCNLAKLERRPNDWTWLLTGKDKATALEHDLNFILTNENKNQYRIDMSDTIVSSLLQFYSLENYPIRRLRSLLLLLMSSIDSREQVNKLRVEAEEASAKLQDGCLESDSSLARYVPYLCQLTVCVLGITCGEFAPSELDEVISTWKSMAASCQSVKQLSQHVDDPQQLLQTLQSLADLARMKGHQSLLTNIVELSTMVSQLTTEDNIETHIVQSSNLCLNYLHLSHSVKAEKALRVVMESVTLPQISNDVVSYFHLSAAEYHLTIGNFDEAERHLENARNVALASSTSQPRKRNTLINRKITTAYASFLSAGLYLERGENHRALKLAKTAVKVLFHDWSQLEQYRATSTDESIGDLSRTDPSNEDSSLDNSRMSELDVSRANTGPEFWALVHPLYRYTCRLASVYEHLGMYQETLYYAEQAQKIAKSMGSSVYSAQATTYLASVSLTAENVPRSLELVAEVKPDLLSSEPTYQAVITLCRAASVYQKAEEVRIEQEFLKKAESMVQALKGKFLPQKDTVIDHLEAESTQIPIKTSLPVRSKGRGRIAAKPAPAPKKTAANKTTTKAMVAPVKPTAQTSEEDSQLTSLETSVLHSRSLALIEKKEWAAAISTLQSSTQLSNLSRDLSKKHFLLGISLMGQSLAKMGSDSVFSLIQDSTLSFPSVAITAKDKNPHGQSLMKRASPIRTPRLALQGTQDFVANLHDAQEHLLEAHAIATHNGDSFLVHRVAAALQNVVVLLSNTSSAGSCASHPAYATCSIELARNLTWRRERKANGYDASKDTKEAWPMAIESPDSRRTSLGFSIDMNRFQREYVDIIPDTWNVVSLSLNEATTELCVTKLQAGFSPFALRLPLDRASSRDVDNDVFDFPQGRSELLELIRQANQTCHDARDMSQKEAKEAWWAQREELDDRLRQLLETIESMWLGGFKGIFSQHHKRTNFLARFQKTFQVILEKHLPSRQQSGGMKRKKNTPRVNLDPRILELFVGLGDATVPDCDMDEPLMDLLYFVVDVLQFHGEPNPYDEIDFDAMVVDTFDALHAYHSAIKETKKSQKETHTILVLDKSLHVFPWESLPCLQGLAVSRVPSLDYLRRSILEAKASSTQQDSAESDSDGSNNSTSSSYTGHHVSINSGTYILNPSTDLTNTQATFGRALSSLPPAWDSIEARAPTEAEFEAGLTNKDIMLYFGHGSGAQYIRGRTVRQLEKCRAVALLMGCSSASLTHVGQFEPYGPVRDYMLSGSPAVVGTLWDVTDRDIDRFAGAVFEEWGLFPRGTFTEDAATPYPKTPGKGKGKASAQRRRKAVAAAPEGKCGTASLVEAVAKARTEACRFKYLTAAAVCVYGIPVYISK